MFATWVRRKTMAMRTTLRIFGLLTDTELYLPSPKIILQSDPLEATSITTLGTVRDYTLNILIPADTQIISQSQQMDNHNTSNK